MAHTSSFELHAKITKVKQEITIGQLYRHYRNPELIYKVIGVALDESSEEPCVIYQAQLSFVAKSKIYRKVGKRFYYASEQL